MSVAHFRFDDGFASFLKGPFEVGTITVNGQSATLQRIVRMGDAVEVAARTQEEIGSVPIFVTDAHLGRLVRFLRMLGFDTLHRNAFTDNEIRRLAEVEGRIVLARTCARSNP